MRVLVEALVLGCIDRGSNPMAKRGGSGRKYTRDAIGRFAGKGYSGQTSGRGARLKAKGKKRDGGGAIVKPSRIGEMKNTISKSSSKRKVNASSRATDRQIARDVAARSKPTAARTSKAATNKAKVAYKRASGDARSRNADLRGADANERRMANSASAKVKNMQRRRSASTPKAGADAPRSKQKARELARVKRASSNERKAYAARGDGAGTAKQSRSASVAKRAQDIYSGKISASKKTTSRLTRTQNPDVLRARIKKGEKLTAARAKKKSVTANSARAAGKPAAAKRKSAPKDGTDITREIGRAKGNKRISNLNKQIKEAGPNAAGLRLEKLKVQTRMPNKTRQRVQPTAKQSAKEASRNDAIRARSAELRRQAGRVNRAYANQARTADTRNKPGSSMIRRPSRKTTRGAIRAEQALKFYRDPKGALKSVNKKRPGFKMPRGMRK